MTREEATIQALRNHIEVLEENIRTIEKEPCEDCIARQPLIDNWNSCADMLMNEGGAEIVMGWIFDAPSVTPTRKKGKWIAQDIHNCHTDFKCSECGYIHSFMHLYGKPTADYTYCPNCGAEMESEK